MGSAFTIAVPDNNTQPLESFAAQYGQGLNNMLKPTPGSMSICHAPVRR
ncbi:hypothetical protein MJ575_19175 [Klebsiella pneumoniae]|nr:hypothetical protein MJ575_19175 [Klebsiella pneumoniae]